MNSNHQAPLLKVKYNICSWNCRHNSNTGGKIKTPLREDTDCFVSVLASAGEEREQNGRQGCRSAQADPQAASQKGETVKPSALQRALSSNV